MTLYERVELRLKQLGLTSYAACKNAYAESGNESLKRDILRDILRHKQEQVRADRLELIAYVLKTSIQWLLGLEDDPDSSPEKNATVRFPRLAFLPVRYKVAAGVWLEMADSSQALGFAPVSVDPDYEGHAQWLEEVDGDSMDKVFPPGTFVHVVSTESIQYEPRTGDHVVVIRTRHQGGLVERSLKAVRITKGRVELWPESTNPAWSKPLSFTDGAADDDVTVEITGLVIGEYRRTRRR